MTQVVELPNAVYAALREAADASGLTPAAWIAAHLVTPDASGQNTGAAELSSNTLAERFAGRTGQIGSGGRECLSENGGEKFSEYLESKRRADRL